MKMLGKMISGTFALVFFLAACNGNKNASPVAEAQVKSATTTVAKDATENPQEKETAKPSDDVAIAAVTAPNYVAKIHRAISFVPKNDGVGLMKVKPGFHYVVLDISVRNTTKGKDVDMGQILLSTKVSDEKGTDYRFNAMAIAAYTLDNPDPQHQAQYNALWGKLKPGEFYRTVVFGLEVPDGQDNFIISMREDDDIMREGKRQEVKFSTR